jgi:5,10-methylenetetrahydromethanopterin reductase
VVEIWTTSAGIPGFTARTAARAEAAGFDGLGLVDSQNLAGDPFIELALAARETTTLRLATAVTNPFTRHPAACAAAIATLHANSGERAVLGIGRGDSALAHLGLAPAPVSTFARFVERLQGYLSGEPVAFDDRGGEVEDSTRLALAGGPDESRMRWIGALTKSKVPVDVAATGPKVISVAACLADRVTFAVGSDVERVKWAIGVAQQARDGAGRGPDALGFGVYVPVFVHPDRDVARRCISGGVASFARFSVMHGSVQGPANDRVRDVLDEVRDRYDMHQHFTHGSPQSAVLTDEAIDTFGIAGPASYCVERLVELIELGLDKVVVLPGGIGLDGEEARAAHRRFVEEVLPAVKTASQPQESR